MPPPRLAEHVESVLTDFKQVRAEALAAGGETGIDIATYLTDIEDTVLMGHTQIVERPLPPRKLVRAITQIIVGLRRASPTPWRFIACCVDTWISPSDQFADGESMAASYAEDPCSDVQPGVAVFGLDAEGNYCLAYSTYTRGDAGEPIWGFTRWKDSPPGLVPRALVHAALVDL